MLMMFINMSKVVYTNGRRDSNKMSFLKRLNKNEEIQIKCRFWRDPRKVFCEETWQKWRDSTKQQKVFCKQIQQNVFCKQIQRNVFCKQIQQNVFFVSNRFIKIHKVFEKVSPWTTLMLIKAHPTELANTVRFNSLWNHHAS